MPRGKDLKPRKMRSDKNSPLRMVECKDCHHTFHRHNLSRSGLCDQCGAERVVKACYQLQHKRGPIYEKWLSKMGVAAFWLKGGNHSEEDN
ncbi:hypothetical protein ES708_26495 [subsurface metagenome]